MNGAPMTTVLLTAEECDRLSEFFEAGAAKFEPQDAYWIHGADDGSDYCRPCALIEVMKEVARFRRLPKTEKRKRDKPSLDGGWSVEHDSTPFCESCGALLEGCLTDYGCEAELDHFTEYGFDIASDDDCRALSAMISARGWDVGDRQSYRSDHEYRSAIEYFADLHALGRKILEQLGKEAA